MVAVITPLLLTPHSCIPSFDINESPLCKDGSLIQSYTWDHVHIKAQYYEIWKEFLLNHAIKI